MTQRKPSGYIVYRGPSLLDGSPIVAIAITASSNRKTGNMVQTYILRDDMRPMQAVQTGADAAICGNCKHRPSTGGACYVVVAQGPTVVYKGAQRGIYPFAVVDGTNGPFLGADGHSITAGRVVRLGTYGDPAAVPARVWERLVSDAQGHTGYTHQWAQGAGSAPALRGLVMASADSPAEAHTAQGMGWRTFRVMEAGAALLPREFECPASEEQGKRKTCATCRACDGAQEGRALKASVAIVVHGSKARRFVPIRPA